MKKLIQRKKIKWIMGTTASIFVMTPIVAVSAVACSSEKTAKEGTNVQIANGLQNYFLSTNGSKYLKASSAGNGATTFFNSIEMNNVTQTNLLKIQNEILTYIKTVLASKPNLQINSNATNNYDLSLIGIKNLTLSNFDKQTGIINNIYLTYKDFATSTSTGLVFSGFKSYSDLKTNALSSTIPVNTVNQFMSKKVTINPLTPNDLGYKPNATGSTLNITPNVALNSAALKNSLNSLTNTCIENDLALLIKNYIFQTATAWNDTTVNAFYNVNVSSKAESGLYDGNIYLQILNNTSVAQSPIKLLNASSEIILNNQNSSIYDAKIAPNNSLFVNISFKQSAPAPAIVSSNQKSLLSYTLSNASLVVSSYDATTKKSSAIASLTKPETFSLNEGSNTLHQVLENVVNANSTTSVNNLYNDVAKTVTPEMITDAVTKSFQSQYTKTPVIAINAAIILEQIIGTNLKTQLTTPITVASANSSPTLLEVLQNKIIGSSLANILNVFGLTDISNFVKLIFSNTVTAGQIVNSSLVSSNPQLQTGLRIALTDAIQSNQPVWTYFANSPENIKSFVSKILQLVQLALATNKDQLKNVTDLINGIFGTKGILETLISSVLGSSNKNATFLQLPVFATLTNPEFFKQITPLFNKDGIVYNMLALNPSTQKLLAGIIPLISQTAIGKDFQLNFQNLIIAILNPVVSNAPVSLSNYLANNISVNGTMLVNPNGTLNSNTVLKPTGTPTISADGTFNVSQGFSVLIKETANFNISALVKILASTNLANAETPASSSSSSAASNTADSSSSSTNSSSPAASTGGLTIGDVLNELKKNGIANITLPSYLNSILKAPISYMIPDDISIVKGSSINYNFSAVNQLSLINTINDNGIAKYETYLPISKSVQMNLGPSMNALVNGIAATVKKNQSLNPFIGLIALFIGPALQGLGGQVDGSGVFKPGMTTVSNIIIPITGSKTKNPLSTVPSNVLYSSSVISSETVIEPINTTAANLTSIFNSLEKGSAPQLTEAQLSTLLGGLATTGDLAPIVSITKNQYFDFSKIMSGLLSNSFVINLYFKVPVLAKIGTNVVLTQNIQFSLLSQTPLTNNQITISNITI